MIKTTCINISKNNTEIKVMLVYACTYIYFKIM